MEKMENLLNSIQLKKDTVNTLRMVYTGQKVCFFAPLSPGKYPNYKNNEFGEELVVQISRPPC